MKNRIKKIFGLMISELCISVGVRMGSFFGGWRQRAVGFEKIQLEIFGVFGLSDMNVEQVQVQGRYQVDPRIDVAIIRSIGKVKGEAEKKQPNLGINSVGIDEFWDDGWTDCAIERDAKQGKVE
jgi:hypothetical protein